MIDCLQKELAVRKHELKNQVIETIYFGGGTPSLLNVADVEKLIQTVSEEYTCTENLECTLEANPDDINLQKVEAWKSAGINRLSVGIQSFDPKDLLWMNRAHSADEGLNCIRIAQQGGIENISLDLIYGLPNMDNDRWMKQINQAIELNVTHISAYCLTVEEKTALHQLVKKKQIQPASNEQQSEQFELLISALKNAGFEHYEISNFAKPGFISKHNSNYWKGVHYLGIGPSAHSFDGNSRSWNIANNQQYMRLINADEIAFEKEILSPKDQFNELLLIGLRTSWGVDMTALQKHQPFSKEFEMKLSDFQAKKWLRIDENQLILSDEGKHWADFIAQELFV
jgi:oxygen-independent coproporphyrinogen-3 oxidase